ncbi:RluA family pseudouridine synthase [Candidatus Falkowbacteria bacterium]|jgi:23S rRNA pseudouridine1911/1915/1917 synthase|nr:RluA family pseudouridine synthase [Candidatus Falkowbacteria bacterium]MBT7007733.1 RluA family pseudouridine synthase [Candidatus Falkowbacteria bacterium]
MKFTIDEQLTKLRLDKYLTEKIDKSRSQIKKDIEAGLVLINNKKAKVHQFLNEGDVIKIKAQNSKLETRILHDDSKKVKIKTVIKNLFAKKEKMPEIKVIEKNDDYLIIEKPTGLLVHPTLKNEPNTLIDLLIKKFPELKKIGDSVALEKNDQIFRPSIVHRLDKDVSGLMIVPRNQDAFDYFKSQFKLRKIYKGYVTLVHGALEKNDDIIDFEISRGVNSGRMAAHPEGSGKGKPSATQFKVLKKFLKFTLVEARPLTGRTNQIRVHFFAYGHPIVGDVLYQSKIKGQKSKIKLNRIFLHAQKLSFTDNNGEEKSFESPLPEKLETILSNLKKTN